MFVVTEIKVMNKEDTKKSAIIPPFGHCRVALVALFGSRHQDKQKDSGPTLVPLVLLHDLHVRLPPSLPEPSRNVLVR